MLGFKNFLFITGLILMQSNTLFAQDWKYLQAMPKDDVLYQLVEDSDSAFICAIIKQADTGIILQKVDRNANTAWRKHYKFGNHQLETSRMIKGDQLYLVGSIALYDSAVQNYTELDGFLMVLNSCFEPIKFYQFKAPGNNLIFDVLYVDGKLLLTAVGMIPGIIPNSTNYFWVDPQLGTVQGPTLSQAFIPNGITYFPNEEMFYATGSYYHGFAPDTATKLIRGYILKMDKQLQPIWQVINDTINPKAYESGQDITGLKEQSLIYLFSDRDYYGDNPSFGPPGISYVSKEGERQRELIIVNEGIKETAHKIILHSNGSLYCLSDYWPSPNIYRGYGALYKISADLSKINQKLINEGPVDQQNPLRSRNVILQETSEGYILVAGSVYNSISGSLDAYIHLLDTNLEYIPLSSTQQNIVDVDCPDIVSDSVYQLNSTLVELTPDSFHIAYIPSKEFKIVGIIAQAEKGNGISLYPNPCRDHFQISGVDPGKSDVNIAIYNLSGKLIQNIDHHDISTPIQLGIEAQQYKILLIHVRTQELNKALILQRVP